MVTRALAHSFRSACLIILTLALAISPMRAATEVTITVTQGGVGVEGAFVALVGSGATKFAAITNAAGQALFSGVPDGGYVALASAPGTSTGSVAVNTPTDTSKTIVVNGSGTVFSPLNVFGSPGDFNQILADGVPGVFYSATGGIPQIFRTADYGGTWTPITIAGDDKTFGFSGVGSGQLATSGFPGEIASTITVGNNAWVYYSRDFGVTWSSIPLPPASFGRLYWSHPAAAGARSTLFWAAFITGSMAYASMPTNDNPTAPAQFTTMTVSYRASADDPIAVVNGSDAGIVAVGATTTSSSPSRTAGDVKLYKIGAVPDATTDLVITLNNGQNPGVVPTVATNGTTPLAPSDMVRIALGGPATSFGPGSTQAPNTLIVYSAQFDKSAAAMSTCTYAAPVPSCVPTTSTTFRDPDDVPTSGAFHGSTELGSTETVLCAATSFATVPNLVVSPRADATLGRCYLVRNGASLDVRQMSNVSRFGNAVFDAGYDGASDNVLMSSDASRGPIKSARSGANASEGRNRPYFPAFPTYAAAGIGASTGGISINGIVKGYVPDVAFNPSAAGQLAAIMTDQQGNRAVGSADAGKTWFDLSARGGRSLAWWNGAPGNGQWLLADIPDGTNLLSAANITTASPFGPQTSLTGVTGTTPAAFGSTAATLSVSAIEPIPGTSMAVVATRTSVSIVTVSPGPSATVSPVNGGTFSSGSVASMAYCGLGSAASIADKTFLALGGRPANNGGGGSFGSLQVIVNTSQNGRAVQSLGISGDFGVVRADCATGTVWVGQAILGTSVGALLKSIDGGATFSAVQTTGHVKDILSGVSALAIDPRSPAHVVVAGYQLGLPGGGVVETRDGGYTWTVLNDGSTAACPASVTGPCGRDFDGGVGVRVIEFPPKISTAPALTAALRASDGITNDEAIAGTTVGMYTMTTRFVQRATLTFGGVVRNNAVTITGGQTVNLSFASSGVNWTASSDQPFVVVSPAAGSGTSSFTVSINNTSGAAAQPGTYAATITIQTTGALVSTQTITVAFTVVAASAAPIGILDTPADQSTGLQGSIPVSGWALDDIEIDRVELWRDVAPGETTPPFASTPSDPRNGKVFISNATFVDGARPDVEAQFGSMPRSYRAGWGYLMLTWGLWNQGNGPFTLYAFAFDKEGNVSTLGSKSINVNNSAANRPFGSIDTPGIGAAASGTITNFGWGLTPKVNGAATCKIQPSGVQVSIDSGPLQPVVYGGNRTDVGAAFAGFSNSNGAGGHYILDTTQYANGPHTIGWLIADDCNRTDGVGSRFFNIQNGSQVAGSRASLTSVQVQAAEPGVDSAEPVTVAHGYGNLPAIVGPDATGLRIVYLKQGDRIELRLPRGYGEAYQRVNGISRALPAGATWDAASGTFYWQPAAAFLGSYELVFLRGPEQIRVRVFVDSSAERQPRPRG